jgi:hypothetical protein
LNPATRKTQAHAIYFARQTDVVARRGACQSKHVQVLLAQHCDEEISGGLARIAETLPPEPSHAMWMNWGPSPPRPDMAYSVEDEVYIAPYASWTDAADDVRHATWPADRMREMEHLATGIQLADENLGVRPARFVTADHMRRLEEIRARHDPDRRFHSWMATS